MGVGAKPVFDLQQVLQTLAKKRPVFHSEADFKYALASEIHASNPAASVRLEVPARLAESRTYYLDLVVRSGGTTYPIELKYRTAKARVDLADEEFLLRGHAAQDTGRYDFWKDVARLEEFVTWAQNSSGYAIFLSNDSLYWTAPRNKITSKEFSIHDKRVVGLGEAMHWASHAGAGSIKSRESEIMLRSSYSCCWREYSAVGNQMFRYLLIEVQPDI